MLILAAPATPAAGDIVVQIADIHSVRIEAQQLLRASYGRAGYGDDQEIPFDDRHLPFVVRLGGRVVGTLTLAIDGPAGLAIDETFPDELDALRRRPGAQLCALTLFAFDAAATKPVLAALFGEIFRTGSSRFGCTELLIEVNPRHRRFYEILLGFDVVGERFNTRVDAPAVLMRRSVGAIGQSIAGQAAGTLYRHFQH
jgi:hypothetical protein